MTDEEFERRLQYILIGFTLVILISAGYYLYIIYNLNNDENTITITYPGDFAKVYLQSEPYSEILIEVDYVDGSEPNNNISKLLVNKLDEVCDKDRIYYEISDIINETTSKEIYTTDDIFKLEQKYRDYYNSKPTIVLYIIYLNGQYENSEQTLGVSYQGSSFAIFKEQIDKINIPFGFRKFISPSDFENSVVIHETGHLLGLVNLNYESETVHEDPESEHHCIFEDCVMYHALEHSKQSYMEKIFQREDLKPPKDYCPKCLEDLSKLKADEY